MPWPTPLQLIERLGGRDAVSTITNAKPNAVTQWYRAGIPYKYHLALLEHASRNGIKLSPAELLHSRRSESDYRKAS